MEKGQRVYVVTKSNYIDSWTYEGKLRTETDVLIHLTRGKQYCFLPERCVFEDIEKAKAVANK